MVSGIYWGGCTEEEGMGDEYFTGQIKGGRLFFMKDLWCGKKNRHGGSASWPSVLTFDLTFTSDSMAQGMRSLVVTSGSPGIPGIPQDEVVSAIKQR